MINRAPEFNDDIESRFEAAILALNSDTSNPNCRGSVLYWIGAREKEYFAWPADLQAVLDKDYNVTTDPNDGDIAVWYAHNSSCPIHHAGIVVKTSGQLLIKSRTGAEKDSEVLVLTPEETFDMDPYIQLVYFKKK